MIISINLFTYTCVPYHSFGSLLILAEGRALDTLFRVSGGTLERKASSLTVSLPLRAEYV